MNQKELRLNFVKPTVASDGQTLSIDNNGHVTLAFFQVRADLPDSLQADVVASVRLHNLEELEQLEKIIKDTIHKHKTREK